jgi:DNA mismatch endonuclease (patch repair protein)
LESAFSAGALVNWVRETPEVDRMSPELRSSLMGRIRSTDTGPEMIVRRVVHGLGFRYRLHLAGLPGRPDLVFRSKKKIILVNGCFWHQHPNCPRAFKPSSHRPFWEAKLTSNVNRDKLVCAALKKLGWKVCIVWECETKDLSGLETRMLRFLR